MSQRVKFLSQWTILQNLSVLTLYPSNILHSELIAFNLIFKLQKAQIWLMTSKVELKYQYFQDLFEAKGVRHLDMFRLANT